jgi:pimeloyl-ACP methyl ester carboxylesterase
LHTGFTVGPAQAQPIVAVHGMTSGPASFERVLHDLSDEFRVVSWAVPGYAGTQAVVNPSDTTEYAGRLIEYLEGAIGRPAVLLGHSLGTLIAADAATRRPDLVAGLVLANPVAGLRHESEKIKEERVGARLKALTQQGVEAFCKQRVPGIFAPGTSDEVTAHAVEVARNAITIDGFAGACELLCASSLIDTLRGYRGPLRMVTGQLDTVSSASLLHNLAGSRNDVEVEVVDGCGHSVHLERPEDFTMRLRTFARRCR